MKAFTKIVVGINGSAESLAALRWALRTGAGNDTPVEVVHCWKPQTLSDAFLASTAELHRASECMLQNEIAAALAPMSVRPAVTGSSVRGNPTTVLVERSREATLLVLGVHATFSLRDVVFGQVVAVCLNQAHCPVVTIDRDEQIYQRRHFVESSATPAL